jgi:hypothetical protein
MLFPSVPKAEDKDVHCHLLYSATAVMRRWRSWDPGLEEERVQAIYFCYLLDSQHGIEHRPEELITGLDGAVGQQRVQNLPWDTQILSNEVVTTLGINSGDYKS